MASLYLGRSLGEMAMCFFPIVFGLTMFFFLVRTQTREILAHRHRMKTVHGIEMEDHKGTMIAIPEQEMNTETGEAKKYREYWQELCLNPTSSKCAGFMHAYLTLTILMSVGAFALETLPIVKYPWNLSPIQYFMLECYFTIVFTLEVTIRLLVSPTGYKNELKDVMNWFDIIAIMPFYFEAPNTLPILFAGRTEIDARDKVFFKLVRLFRVLRIFKIARRFKGTRILGMAVRQSYRPLLMPMFFLMVFTMIFASAIFFVEPCYSKDDCVFTDVFNTAYYCMVTITTVGYGDQIPASMIGRAVGIVVMLFGAFFMAMPLAIIGNNFDEAWNNEERRIKEEKKKLEAEKERKEGVKKDPSPFEDARTPQDVFNLCLQKYFSMGITISTLRRRLANGNESLDIPDMNAFDTKMDLLDTGTIADAMRDLQLKHKDLQSDLIELTKAEEASNPIAVLNENKATSFSSIGVLNRLIKFRVKRSLTSRSISDLQRAKGSEKIRDRLWLICEYPDLPGRNKKYAWWFQHIMIMLVMCSIIIFALQTLPELAKYGENEEMCARAVFKYCNKKTQEKNNGIDSYAWNSEDAHYLDPACYPQTLQVNKTTLPWNGCASSSNVKTWHDCKFPKPEWGLSCKEENYKDYYDANHNPDAKYPNVKQVAFSSENMHPMCANPLCKDNKASMLADMTDTWPMIEAFFVFVFTFELFIRLWVCRSTAAFFNGKQAIANWIDIGAIAPFYIEVSLSLMRYGHIEFEPAGGDPSFMKMIRLFAVLRVFKMTRHFKRTKTLTETVQKCWSKLILPLFFFFIFVIIFSSMIWVAESGGRTCQIPDNEVRPWVKKFHSERTKWEDCDNSIYLEQFGVRDSAADGYFSVGKIPCEEGKFLIQNKTNSAKLCIEGTIGSEESKLACDTLKDKVSDYAKFYCSNATIISRKYRHLITKPLDPTSYTDFDDIIRSGWLVVVTMTTVGYGGISPVTNGGKLVAIAAMLFGSFYLAMPLTIVGGIFYSTYLEQEEKIAKTEKEQKEISDTKGTGNTAKITPLDEGNGDTEKGDIKRRKSVSTTGAAVLSRLQKDVLDEFYRSGDTISAMLSTIDASGETSSPKQVTSHLGSVERAYFDICHVVTDLVKS